MSFPGEDWFQPDLSCRRSFERHPVNRLQIARREFLQLGGLQIGAISALGISLPKALAQKAVAGAVDNNVNCIFMFLQGGASHIDMYDMKPDAPSEYRGIWRPIPTNVAGFDITELFPKQAKVADKFSIVRSLHHDTGDHFAGGHRMLTTKIWESVAPITEASFRQLARLSRISAGTDPPACHPISPCRLRRALACAPDISLAVCWEHRSTRSRQVVIPIARSSKFKT